MAVFGRKLLNHSRRRAVLLLAVCSLLAVQFAWAEHQVEHLFHDTGGDCALCLRLDRADDLAVCSSSLAIHSQPSVPFDSTLDVVAAEATAFTHYRSRASPQFTKF